MIWYLRRLTSETVCNAQLYNMFLRVMFENLLDNFLLTSVGFRICWVF